MSFDKVKETQKEKVSKPRGVSHKARSKKSSKFPAENNMNMGVAKEGTLPKRKLSMC